MTGVQTCALPICRFNIVADRPGYIMAIATLVPRVDYYQFTERYVRHTKLSDMFRPEFNGIGYQDVLVSDLNTEFPEGLNVNAAFGTAGSYSPTNAPSSVQPAGGVSTPYVDYTNMKFQSALGLAKQMAEIDLIKAQADETRGRTLNPDETQRGQKLTNDLTALNARLS